MENRGWKTVGHKNTARPDRVDEVEQGVLERDTIKSWESDETWPAV